MTRLERRLVPHNEQETSVVLQPPQAAIVQGVVDAVVWRGSATLRQTHFLCSQCRKATPYSGDEVCGMGTCGVCGSAVAIMSRDATTPEMQALTEMARSTARGRSYKFLQGRSQTVGPATIVPRGSPNYTTAMIASTHANGVTVDGRTEARPRDGVASFDSWLCIVTGGEWRAYTREDVKKLVRNPSAEGYVIEFLHSLARKVDVVDEEGVTRTVQA